MNKKLYALPLALGLAFGITACGKKPEAAAPQQRAVSDGAGARAVSITEVVLRPMAGSLTAAGLLVPREEIAIGSEIAGYRVADVLVEEGASIKKGQTLAKLDPGLLQAKIAQARASVVQAQAQGAASPR